MNMTKNSIRINTGRLAFCSTIVAVFLLVACGDTTTTVPGPTLVGAAVTAANTSGAMMAQTSGLMMQTPGAMMRTGQ